MRAGRPLGGWNLTIPKALSFLMLSFYSLSNAFHQGFSSSLGIVFNTGIPCTRKNTGHTNGREKQLQACHQNGANHAEGDEKSSSPPGSGPGTHCAATASLCGITQCPRTPTADKGLCDRAETETERKKQKTAPQSCLSTNKYRVTRKLPNIPRSSRGDCVILLYQSQL